MSPPPPPPRTRDRELTRVGTDAVAAASLSENPDTIPCACTICCETVHQATAPHIIDDAEICDLCVKENIVPLFQAAINNEQEYPVTWGSVIIPATHFWAELGRGFGRAYERREVEYAIPLAERVVCGHVFRKGREGNFKGSVLVGTTALAIAWPHRHLTPECVEAELEVCGSILDKRGLIPGQQFFCHRCRGLTCRVCERPMSFDYAEHVCERRVFEFEAPDRDGLVQGKHFQLCPVASCRHPVALGDGCNTVTCPVAACRTSFCFICGQQADHDGDHWASGRCPRWNQPDNPRAQFDPPRLVVQGVGPNGSNLHGGHSWLRHGPAEELELQFNKRLRMNMVAEFCSRAEKVFRRETQALLHIKELIKATGDGLSLIEAVRYDANPELHVCQKLKREIDVERKKVDEALVGICAQEGWSRRSLEINLPMCWAGFMWFSGQRAWLLEARGVGWVPE
ncbi:hypothetical protein LTR78_008980 [Recurvomyces mirabilis]|uniref:IBR domain-containing protein n=1 Tax=Recurvomyces mirabilis TaxID=574656 RepID=A0AAE0TQF5_9PEZI|nr:hypothetical protein LTR78_008980 [Recurvomyces mirabilis]KAK5159780.1 hypothetical protein LTS14_001885 [Recurvomyces mirabilis]